MSLLAAYLLRRFFSCALKEANFEKVREFRRKIRQRKSERTVAGSTACHRSVVFRVHLEN
jgi:hypothetical protein